MYHFNWLGSRCNLIGCAYVDAFERLKFLNFYGRMRPPIKAFVDWHRCKWLRRRSALIKLQLTSFTPTSGNHQQIYSSTNWEWKIYIHETTSVWHKNVKWLLKSHCAVVVTSVLTCSWSRMRTAGQDMLDVLKRKSWDGLDTYRGGIETVSVGTARREV